MSGKFECDNADWLRLLYERQAARLILYGRALGLSHSEAEDVLQETFLTMLKLQSPPSNPECYSLSCYRNYTFNYKRTLWRRIKREFESVSWFEQDSPDDTLSKLASKAIEQIPQEQREVIVLKIWHNLTFEEIGELLSISQNTVAGRYRYGLAKLKKILIKYNYEGIESDRTEIKLPCTTFTLSRG